jgi:heat shock protein HslJ
MLDSCAGSAPRAANLADLRGSWQLAVAVPVGARLPTLTVDDRGAIHGNSGVNRYSGSLDVAALAEGHWKVGPVAGTRMAGPEGAMALETSFLQALQGADTAWLDGGQLHLRRGGSVLATLERVQFGQ